MRVAAVQLGSTKDPVENLFLAGNGIRGAADAGARLVVLPEATMANFTTRLSRVAQPLDGPFAQGIRAVAAECGVLVVVGMFTPGSTPSPAGKGDRLRVRNTVLVTDGVGIDAHYDKVHLYDALGSRESDTVEPGADLLVVEALGTRIGIATCYDMRFPAQFTDLGRRGAEVICLPTSWAPGEGKVEQLRTLVRARAMDSQSFVVMADQVAPMDAGTRPLGVGHSLVAGPTGAVVAEAGEDPTVLVAELDVETVAKVRQALPIL